jgi:hypothetical protein
MQNEWTTCPDRCCWSYPDTLRKRLQYSLFRGREGMITTQAETINADVLEFSRS